MSTKRSQPSPATTLTTETSLSLLYRVLRTVIRPFRPRLVKPGKPLPAGSPRLTDHPKTKNKCSIVEHQDQATGIWLYDFVPDSRTSSTSLVGSERKHRVLYFAGGGFQSPPAGEHWAFVSTLASDARLASVFDFTIVSYPLAPNSPACDSLPVLRRYLNSVCEEASTTASKVTVMGDSAGGNIALSLGLWWTDETSLNENPGVPNDIDARAAANATTPEEDDDQTTITGDTPNKIRHKDITLDPSAAQSTSVLSNIVLISPAADLRNTNPAIKQADQYDPVLSMSLTEQTASAWTQASSQATPSAGPSSRSDPYISPVLTSEATLRKIKDRGIHIHGAIGTHDVLAPDAELFRQKCVDVDVPGDWLVWEGQMHCFVLAGIYGMREGKEGIRWVVDVLARNV